MTGQDFQDRLDAIVAEPIITRLNTRRCKPPRKHSELPANRTLRWLRQRLPRKALNDALPADANYRAAKTALENARAVPAYVAARTEYENQNVSENFSALGPAKGEYALD
jgi:hypothetical protein